jgi:hypothetical protein
MKQTTHMKETMKSYNVTIVNPFRNSNETHMTVSADRIDFDANTFRYNDHYPACEIVAIEEVPQAKLDAMAAYFNRYGTACE